MPGRPRSLTGRAPRRGPPRRCLVRGVEQAGSLGDSGLTTGRSVAPSQGCRRRRAPTTPVAPSSDHRVAPLVKANPSTQVDGYEQQHTRSAHPKAGGWAWRPPAPNHPHRPGPLDRAPIPRRHHHVDSPGGRTCTNNPTGARFLPQDLRPRLRRRRRTTVLTCSRLAARTLTGVLSFQLAFGRRRARSMVCVV